MFPVFLQPTHLRASDLSSLNVVLGSKGGKLKLVTELNCQTNLLVFARICTNPTSKGIKRISAIRKISGHYKFGNTTIILLRLLP